MSPNASTASSGATAWFEDLFRAESSFVWRVLRRLGVPERDLEDVTHEVFLTVYRRLDDYDRTRPLRPWLFGIALRTARRFRDLARHRHEVMTDTPDLADATPDVEAQAIETRELLLLAMDEVDLTQRAVLILHDIEGWTMPEIAAAVDVPLNTAYSRLRLARAGVKAAVMRLRRGQP